MKFKKIFSFDEDFYPAALWNRVFLKKVRNAKNGIPLRIGIARNDIFYSVYKTQISSKGIGFDSSNYTYVERLTKTMLWIHGGNKIVIDGPTDIVNYIKELYSKKGKRFFDANFMSDIYGKPFSVVAYHTGQNIHVKEQSIPVNRELKGCRIGFDLGASDRKVSAVIDGKVVFSEEVPWDPGEQDDPEYHYHEIMTMLRRAAQHLPRVDSIGGSSAGVYINNRVMAASLFRSIPPCLFEKRIKNIFIDIQREWNVPLKVINDGEVTALAGSMSLQANAVLGIALGSSEAGGYVDRKGNITTQLNELAFVPIDFNKKAPVDSWSQDSGCGVQYLSQIAVIRLANKAGVTLPKEQTLAEQLTHVQELLAEGDQKAFQVFKTIGIYLGYAIAYYADFYNLEHVLILGRVTSGQGGHIILEQASQVLREEFTELYDKISLHLPDESNRRVGQSIAAASLPLISSEN
ncbi:MAG: ROK family protein [Atribacterota bacterium]|nr:ROK family protein [Atribacterota bacterium]MDD4895589.1 ROK family protein [Atribacterota bacterium]MDD5636840.1 ROK family protein [Atribacterota bacterium]